MIPLTLTGTTMRKFRLSASTVLDVDGRGSVRVAPSAKDWVIKSVAVRCTTAVSEATASVYADLIGNEYLIDSTFTGSSGDTSDTIIDVRDGYAVIIEWVGGDAGATATATYSGEET